MVSKKIMAKSQNHKKYPESMINVTCDNKIKKQEVLIKQITNVNCRNKNNDTPLMVASKKGEYASVRILIKKGAKINTVNKQGDTALHLACQRKYNAKVIAYLISKGAQINKRNSLGMSPLIVASAWGCKNNTAKLLKFSPNLNIKTLNDETAFTYAIVLGHKKVVTLLIDAGVNINKKDNFGWTPLNYAIYEKRKDIVNLLVKNGAVKGK
ncbi:MAG: ankyrin repeat domain-containing protein [Candidatus Omnitrophota bacterium]